LKDGPKISPHELNGAAAREGGDREIGDVFNGCSIVNLEVGKVKSADGGLMTVLRRGYLGVWWWVGSSRGWGPAVKRKTNRWGESEMGDFFFEQEESNVYPLLFH
jgi:hypothetical protein